MIFTATVIKVALEKYFLGFFFTIRHRGTGLIIHLNSTVLFLRLPLKFTGAALITCGFSVALMRALFHTRATETALVFYSESKEAYKEIRFSILFFSVVGVNRHE